MHPKQFDVLHHQINLIYLFHFESNNLLKLKFIGIIDHYTSYLGYHFLHSYKLEEH